MVSGYVPHPWDVFPKPVFEFLPGVAPLREEVDVLRNEIDEIEDQMADAQALADELYEKARALRSKVDGLHWEEIKIVHPERPNHTVPIWSST